MSEKKIDCVFNHEWEQEYYGIRCKRCGVFFADGCEPWNLDDDETPTPIGTGE